MIRMILIPLFFASSLASALDFADAQRIDDSASHLGSTHQGEDIEYASCVFRETKLRLASLYPALSK